MKEVFKNPLKIRVVDSRDLAREAAINVLLERERLGLLKQDANFQVGWK